MTKITRRELLLELNKIDSDENVNQRLLQFVENKFEIDSSHASLGPVRQSILKCVSRFSAKIASLKRKQRKGLEDFIMSNQD